MTGGYTLFQRNGLSSHQGLPTLLILDKMTAWLAGNLYSADQRPILNPALV